MKAVIMAGGRGSRIAGICADRPKPMMSVCGKPILERQVENLAASSITDITIVTEYKGQIIKDYFGDGAKWGVSISYYEEDAEHPLGTAGALFQMLANGLLTCGQDANFIFMCGDLVCGIDFRRLISFHNSLAAFRPPLATLLVHPNSHPFDSALIETEKILFAPGGIPKDTGKVTAWLGRNRDGTSSGEGGAPQTSLCTALKEYHQNLVNSGIAVITSELLEMTKKRFLPKDMPLSLDLDKDVLRPAIATGLIYAFRTTEYICDMGTPERYKKVTDDERQGKVRAKNLVNKQRAVFLDRDGTLNLDVHYIRTPEELELLPGVADAVRMINESGYLAVVITNQSIIARGDATWQVLLNIHAKLETLLGEKGAYLDGIYVCPHHPDKGFEGERIEYKRVCDCRKPSAGLIFQAAKEMNIDVPQSIMIGDSDRDVECGKRAGCLKNIKLYDGYTLLDAVKETIGR